MVGGVGGSGFLVAESRREELPKMTFFNFGVAEAKAVVLIVVLVCALDLADRTGAGLVYDFEVDTARSNDFEDNADLSDRSSSSVLEGGEEVRDKSEDDEQVVEEKVSWSPERSPSSDDSESLDKSDSSCGW